MIIMLWDVLERSFLSPVSFAMGKFAQNQVMQPIMHPLFEKNLLRQKGADVKKGF